METAHSYRTQIMQEFVEHVKPFLHCSGDIKKLYLALKRGKKKRWKTSLRNVMSERCPSDIDKRSHSCSTLKSRGHAVKTTPVYYAMLAVRGHADSIKVCREAARQTGFHFDIDTCESETEEGEYDQLGDFLGEEDWDGTGFTEALYDDPQYHDPFLAVSALTQSVMEE